MKIVRSWREQKIILKRWFPNLDDRDFLFEEGQKESMLERLALKLNKSKRELDLLMAQTQLY